MRCSATWIVHEEMKTDRSRIPKTFVMQWQWTESGAYKLQNMQKHHGSKLAHLFYNAMASEQLEYSSIVYILIFTFKFMHLADAFIQSDLQAIYLYCQYVCSLGTHNLCAANAML